MPEYSSSTDPGARRVSIQSMQSSLESQSTASDAGRTVLPHDQNTVLLSRFEDANPILPYSLSTSSTSELRLSLHTDLQGLDIGAIPSASPLSPSRPSQPALTRQDQLLLDHYRNFIAPKIMPFAGSNCGSSHTAGDGRDEDPIMIESRKFPPVSRYQSPRYPITRACY